MNTMKFALLVGAALALSAGHAAADPALATSDVNIRSGPGTQYPLVGHIPGGSTVEAVNCNAGWCAARFGGRAGYVNQSYLDFGGDAQPAPPVQVRPDLGGPPPGAIPVAPPGSYPPPPAGYYPPPPPVYREPPPYGYPPPYDPPSVYGPGPRYRDGVPPLPPPRNTQRPADSGRAQGAPQRQQQKQPSKQQQSAPAPTTAPTTAPAPQPPPATAGPSQPAPAAAAPPQPAPTTAAPPKQDAAPHQGQSSGPPAPAHGKPSDPAQQPAAASQAPNAPADKK